MVFDFFLFFYCVTVKTNDRLRIAPAFSNFGMDFFAEPSKETREEIWLSLYLPGVLDGLLLEEVNKL